MAHSVEDSSAYLIRFDGEDGAVHVRVRGRTAPGVVPSHDYLDVEFLISAPFLTGRLTDILTRSDVDRWSTLLDKLARGQMVSWPDDGRAILLRVGSR